MDNPANRDDPAKRNEKGQFGPNNAANLSGRSAIAKQMREYMSGFTKECIDGLIAIARNEAVEPKDRIAAYKWLAEQVTGKAPQAITGPDGEALSTGARELAEALVRKLAEAK